MPNIYHYLYRITTNNIHPKTIPYPHLCRTEGKEWFSLHLFAETKQVISIRGSAKLSAVVLRYRHYKHY